MAFYHLKSFFFVMFHPRVGMVIQGGSFYCSFYCSSSTIDA
jgi:hypothetical protein